MSRAESRKTRNQATSGRESMSAGYGHPAGTTSEIEAFRAVSQTSRRVTAKELDRLIRPLT